MKKASRTVVGFDAPADPVEMGRPIRKQSSKGIALFMGLALADLILVAAVWPHTNASGRGVDGDHGILIVASVIDRPFPSQCTPALIDYASNRARLRIAGEFPTRHRFQEKLDQATDAYASMNCPIGPLLAVRVAADEMARKAIDDGSEQRWAFWKRS